MRVWDFGWQPAEKGWTAEQETAEIRLLVHATDPDYLEQRLGRPASKGCVRIPAAMNRYLDHYGVLDAEYEREALCRSTGARPRAGAAGGRADGGDRFLRRLITLVQNGELFRLWLVFLAAFTQFVRGSASRQPSDASMRKASHATSDPEDYLLRCRAERTASTPCVFNTSLASSHPRRA